MRNHAIDILRIKDLLGKTPEATRAIDWLALSSLPVGLVNDGTVPLRTWYHAARRAAANAES